MTHLHTRSWFSFGAGAASPAALVNEALRHGQTALAITDLNTLAGAVRHSSACQAAGIRPVLGATLTVSGAPLVLLCADDVGYANLCDLLTLAHRHAAESGDRKSPGIQLDELQGRTDGLFCLSGDHEGALCRLIDSKQWTQAKVVARHLAALFPNRFFIELCHLEREADGARLRALIELAESLSLPTVASNAVRHATPGQYPIYDALLCVGLKITHGQDHWLRPTNARAYLCSEARLRKLGLPIAAIANSDAIARECSVDLTPGFVTPPCASVPEGSDATNYLKTLCAEGLCTRGLDKSRTAKLQLKKEIDIICQLGLEEFFLVVREVVQFARSRGIRCAGRGSAANSLIAYLLGVTEVDPIRHHLLFERFLHAGRKGMPDVDVDFDSARREEVIEWMNRRWGEEHTAMTANVNTYGLRSAIRDLGKVVGYPLELLDRANKHLPHTGVRHALKYRAQLAEHLGGGIALDVMLRLCIGLHDGVEPAPRHLSLHSGGMVLSRRPLRHISPIQSSANTVRQLQFNKDDVEKLGLIKFDVLGLRMLSVLSEAQMHIRSTHAKQQQALAQTQNSTIVNEPTTNVEALTNIETTDIKQPAEANTSVDIDRIPFDDPATFELIRSAKTVGLFQIESPGQWNLLARSQPEHFNDLVAQVALFRPGPLQGNMVHPYIGRRRGWLPTTFPHPSLEKALRDTYGLILFQEQVLEVAHCFAGMPLGEADQFRSLMSRFRDSDEMESMRERFVEGAMRTHAQSEHPVSKALAHAMFDLVSKFVGYGFCKSHAAAFARTVYQSAYLKAHYPAAFLAGVLEHQPGYLPLQTIIEEARLLGITVLPPCVLWSGVTYGLENLGDELAIRVSLCQIENVSPESAARLVLERNLRPFESLDDLFWRVSLPKDVWDLLARSGALDAFDSRREVLAHLKRLQKLAEKPRGAQLTLTDLELPRDDFKFDILEMEKLIEWDFATMNITTGPHPLALHRPHLNKLAVRSIESLFDLPTGTNVLVAGAVISRQQPPTAKGMTFLILEDETYRIPTALFPTLYPQFELVLREPMLLVEGALESTPEEKRTGHGKGIYRSILIQRIWSLSDVLRTEKLMHGEVAPDNTTSGNAVYGASGFPGENPRTGGTTAYR